MTDPPKGTRDHTCWPDRSASPAVYPGRRAASGSGGGGTSTRTRASTTTPPSGRAPVPLEQGVGVQLAQHLDGVAVGQRRGADRDVLQELLRGPPGTACNDR